jgi:hypothetical protein
MRTEISRDPNWKQSTGLFLGRRQCSIIEIGVVHASDGHGANGDIEVFPETMAVWRWFLESPLQPLQAGSGILRPNHKPGETIDRSRRFLVLLLNIVGRSDGFPYPRSTTRRPSSYVVAVFCGTTSPLPYYEVTMT